MKFGKATVLTVLFLTTCIGCDDPREPASTGLLSEPVSCLDQQKICAGMQVAAIDQWIASGGATGIEDASCGEIYSRQKFSTTEAIMKWCGTEPHISVKGRKIDYSFIISDGKISSITIERRGTFP
jgi:hypothetical protein